MVKALLVVFFADCFFVAGDKAEIKKMKPAFPSEHHQAVACEENPFARRNKK